MGHAIQTDAELRARGYSVPVYRAVQALGGTAAAAETYGRSIATIRKWMIEPFRIPDEALDAIASAAGVDRSQIERDAAIAKARLIRRRSIALQARADAILEAVDA